MSATAAPLLELVDLARHFPVRSAFGRRVGWLRAVDGVSLQEIGRASCRERV